MKTLAPLKSEVKALETARTALQQAKADLQKKLSEAQQENKNLIIIKKEKEALQIENNALAKARSKVQEELKSSRSQEVRLQKRLDELSKRASGWKTEKEALSSEWTKVQKANKDLRLRLEASEVKVKSLVALKDQISALEEERNSMVSAAKKVEVRMNSLTSTKQGLVP